MQYTVQTLRDMINAQMTLMICSLDTLGESTSVEREQYEIVNKTFDKALQLLLKNGLRYQR